MNTLMIQGGRKLSGSVTVSGCKNAALPILFATLLTRDICVIERVPDIEDVRVALRILSSLGAETERQGDCVRVDTRNATAAFPLEETAKLRGSLYLLGASLGRFGKAKFGRTGGCDFGGRPIQYHLDAFRALGARVREEDGTVSLAADRLQGTDVYFPAISVGATVNTMLAAVAANGKTRICGAAREPHVADTARFLRCCGVEIRGEGTGCVEITGTPRLHGCRYRLISDMIECGTFLAAAVATGGKIAVQGCETEDLAAVIGVLRDMGADVHTEPSGTVTLKAEGRPCGCDIVTSPYPGFPTDLQPQFGVLLSLSRGGGTVTESVFESRFRYTEALQTMNCRVRICGNSAIFRGGDCLHGAEVFAPDLRAGAALAVAALAADGNTVLRDNGFLERGYERFPEKLRKLGACVSAAQMPAARCPAAADGTAKPG